MPLRVLLISLAFVITGCASRAYVVPVDGPRATIKYRLVSPVPEASVFAFDDSKCANRKWVGGLKGAPLPYEKMMGKPLDQSKAELSTTIVANRPFLTLVFLDVSNSTYCGVNWAFVPNEAASYEADVSYADEKCDVKLHRIEPNGGGRTLIETPPATCQ